MGLHEAGSQAALGQWHEQNNSPSITLLTLHQEASWLAFEQEIQLNCFNRNMPTNASARQHGEPGPRKTPWKCLQPRCPEPSPDCSHLQSTWKSLRLLYEQGFPHSIGKGISIFYFYGSQHSGHLSSTVLHLNSTNVVFFLLYVNNVLLSSRSLRITMGITAVTLLYRKWRKNV